MNQPNPQTTQTKQDSDVARKIEANHQGEDTDKILAVLSNERDAAVVYDTCVDEHRLVVRSPHTGHVQRESLDAYSVGPSTGVELRCAITGEPFTVTLKAVPTAKEVTT